MPPKNKIFITGATGRLGKAVFSLIDAIPLVRKPNSLKNEIVTDFSPSELKKILKDASAIIHLAGSIDMLDDKKLEEVNVNLTRKIVEAAPEKCKMIFTSSISVYGKKLAKIPANEKTAINPDRAYARTKYEAEKIISTKPNHVILRIGTLYGKEFVDYLYVIKQIDKGKMRIIGDGSNQVPFVHVQDVARAIVASIGKGHGIYVLAGEPITQKEVLDIAAKELGVKPPVKKINFKLAHTFASVNQTIARILGKKPKLTTEHIAILASDRSFYCAKAKKELGFRNKPITQGIKEIVQEYRKSATN